MHHSAHQGWSEFESVNRRWRSLARGVCRRSGSHRFRCRLAWRAKADVDCARQFYTRCFAMARKFVLQFVLILLGLKAFILNLGADAGIWTFIERFLEIVQVARFMLHSFPSALRHPQINWCVDLVRNKFDRSRCVKGICSADSERTQLPRVKASVPIGVTTVTHRVKSIFCRLAPREEKFIDPAMVRLASPTSGPGSGRRSCMIGSGCQPHEVATGRPTWA